MSYKGHMKTTNLDSTKPTYEELEQSLAASEKREKELVKALERAGRDHHDFMGYISRKGAYPDPPPEGCATRDFSECTSIDCYAIRAVLTEKIAGKTKV